MLLVTACAAMLTMSSASPMWTRRCAGDLGYAGALWVKSSSTTWVEAKAASSNSRPPMTAWWTVLGSPELTPAVRDKLIAGLHQEVGSRSIAELEAQRDEILLGLLELRNKFDNAPATARKAARTS